MLLDHLVDQNSIDIEQEDVRMICDLIEGKKQGYENSESIIFTCFIKCRGVDV